MKKINKKNYFSPFKAYVPQKNLANKTIAPLYDVVNREEAITIAANNRQSFLHVTKAEIELDSTVKYNDKLVYQTAKQNLDNFIKNKVFIQHNKQAYFIYKITYANHSQLGLVCNLATDSIKTKFIKQHEYTRVDKEQDRVNNILAVHGSISPVMLTHKRNNNITDLLYRLSNREADYSAEDNHKIEHSIYIIDKLSDIEAISKHYLELNNLYVADGHHRLNAASKVADELKDNDTAQYLMTAIFPEEQLNILGYHRIIFNLNNNTLEDFFSIIYKYFDYNISAHAILPNNPGHFGMYINNKWYSLKLRNEYLEQNKLDCELLNSLIINPILGIKDIRTDNNIDFVGGSEPYSKIENIVNKHEQAVAFTLAPIVIKDLFSYSDQDKVMPPKSTWFYPKLCDGLLFYLFE